MKFKWTYFSSQGIINTIEGYNVHILRKVFVVVVMVTWMAADCVTLKYCCILCMKKNILPNPIISTK